ncbi:MAG: DUF2452 domain-containing protein [Raineya sp.]|nr:DUF2452 domain-containing protein [Raineya sp.]MDW8296523.1 DUF2452 domain-containing protein [Raineya sp.]
MQENNDFINPIDKDKTAENPHLLPYAHTRGGVVVKPEDMGKIKGKALSAMHQQTEKQMSFLYEQMQLLVEQAKRVQERKVISEKIYNAHIGFEPIVGQAYYLYQKADGSYLLSIVSPEEWGARMPFEKYCAKVTLLADHTWDVLENKEYIEYE